MFCSRFLQPWILYGMLNDPFDEFFVKSASKYLMTRGRTFWTRSFNIQQDTVPHFLENLKENILNCGKSMNLLKLSHPQVLCCYLIEFIIKLIFLVAVVRVFDGTQTVFVVLFADSRKLERSSAKCFSLLFASCRVFWNVF